MHKEFVGREYSDTWAKFFSAQFKPNATVSTHNKGSKHAIKQTPPRVKKTNIKRARKSIKGGKNVFRNVKVKA
jgi:hypothetical protein